MVVLKSKVGPLCQSEFFLYQLTILAPGKDEISETNTGRELSLSNRTENETKLT